MSGVMRLDKIGVSTRNGFKTLELPILAVLYGHSFEENECVTTLQVFYRNGKTICLDFDCKEDADKAYRLISDYVRRKKVQA